MTVPNSSLPISNLVNVTSQLASSGAQAQNVSTLLILSNNTVVNPVQRLIPYSTLAALQLAFGGSSPEALAADLWFSQAPQPTSVYVGRWVQAASAGQLIGGVLSTAQQAIATWNAITTGSFHVTIDGGSSQSLTGLNFAAAANLSAVATVINLVLTGATIAWSSANGQFTITSSTTGATSAVSFVTAGTGGVDISAMLKMTNTAGNGAYQSPGLVAETALSAVTILDNDYGQSWYALEVLGAANADHQAVTAYIEGSNTRHHYVITSQEAGCLSTASNTDILALLNPLGYLHTSVQYSSSSPYAVASLIARLLTTNWGGNNTTITAMWKQEPGVAPEFINQTQAQTLFTKGGNAFLPYNNGSMIIQPGQVVGSSLAVPVFMDTVIGVDVLTILIQNAIFNALLTTPTKIAQTDAGMQILVGAAVGVLEQFVTNGFLAPGVWNSSGFGDLQQGATLLRGYYVYAQPVAQQSQASRAARFAVPIQIACKLAGAVHTVPNVNIVVLP